MQISRWNHRYLEQDIETTKSKTKPLFEEVGKDFSKSISSIEMWCHSDSMLLEVDLGRSLRGPSTKCCCLKYLCGAPGHFVRLEDNDFMMLPNILYIYMGPFNKFLQVLGPKKRFAFPNWIGTSESEVIKQIFLFALAARKLRDKLHTY